MPAVKSYSIRGFFSKQPDFWLARLFVNYFGIAKLPSFELVSNQG